MYSWGQQAKWLLIGPVVWFPLYLPLDLSLLWLITGKLWVKQENVFSLAWLKSLIDKMESQKFDTFRRALQIYFPPAELSSPSVCLYQPCCKLGQFHNQWKFCLNIYSRYFLLLYSLSPRLVILSGKTELTDWAECHFLFNLLVTSGLPIMTAKCSQTPLHREDDQFEGPPLSLYQLTPSFRWISDVSLCYTVNSLTL